MCQKIQKYNNYMYILFSLDILKHSLLLYYILLDNEIIIQ